MDNVFSNDQDAFSCSICLDLLRVPVTIPCGHSYCLNCIKGYFDQRGDQGGTAQCPQCRQTFSARPALNKNTIIAELVEKLKEARSPRPHCFAGSGEIECDVCGDSKSRAVKSCLVCLASYCETHLKLHNELNPGGKHKVVDAIERLQNKICRRHDKLLEVFCCTDQQIICLLCIMDDHRGHETVSAEAVRAEKQKLLCETQKKSKKRLKHKGKEFQDVKYAMDTLKRSAAAAVADNDRCFQHLMRSIERRCSRVNELIRAQEKAEVSRAEGLLKRLEQEIAELKRRDAELEQLSHTEDHIHFLQSLPLLNEPCGTDINIRVNPHISFGEVGQSLFKLKQRLDDQWPEEEAETSKAVERIHTVLLPEYRTREEFLKCFHPFTLDPATARNSLHLSKGNTLVSHSKVATSYRNGPERFDGWLQVLCMEGITERCYWEAQWSGHWANIAVSYKTISRKGGGNECRFGYNDQSWSLKLSRSTSCFRHKNKETKLPLVRSSRIGVYVDHRAGTLAFYSITDTMTLLHRVQTTFTHTLYPGFGFDFGLIPYNSSVQLVGE
ncbi:tripartite motif-containing protein 16-like [Sardina pilchardus]|uniref:tripartite motif-containing protein 16-like n=1 Tax=Sardina pilchardus TaxID=27697 RepID=UPI002E0F9A41